MVFNAKPALSIKICDRFNIITTMDRMKLEMLLTRTSTILPARKYALTLFYLKLET